MQLNKVIGVARFPGHSRQRARREFHGPPSDGRIQAEGLAESRPVSIEFPDVKHNANITPKDWEREFFSTKTYTRTATGQAAYGSVNDFYSELSSGLFHVQGKAFEAVQVIRNRLAYSTTGSTGGTGNAGGGNRDSALLREALDKLVAREGASVLNGYERLSSSTREARRPARSRASTGRIPA